MTQNNNNIRLSLAIASILGAQTATCAPTVSTELDDIVVTATRRSLNLQAVPITIQAMTGEVIEQLNVQTFDDFIKFLPNVTSAGQGPGQNQIYMRGLAAVTDANQVSGGTGPFPNVAVYLGRSNWLFAGSDRAGRRSTVIMSLIQTAKLHGLDPYAYLRDVLERLPLTPHSRIGDLLPGVWKLSRPTTH